MKTHEQWLKKAGNDLLSAKKLISGPDPMYETCMYHCQQCAEKSLKAFIAYNQIQIVRTHDLVELVMMCAEEDAQFTSLELLAASLNPFSTIYRYPDDISEPSADEANQAIISAGTIFSFVQDKLFLVQPKI